MNSRLKDLFFFLIQCFIVLLFIAVVFGVIFLFDWVTAIMFLVNG